MKYTDRLNGTARRVLACTIAAVLIVPGTSLADNPQTADGIAVTLEPGAYTSSGQVVLSVLNAGSMEADGGVAVSATGNSAHGARITGAGSSLLFNGGGVSTGGNNSNSVYALAGGVVTLGRDQNDVGTQITTGGSTAYGLYASGAGAVINGDGVTVNTAGSSSYAARNEGGTLSLSNSDLFTSGIRANGVYSDAGAVTSLTNVNVTTLGDTAHAVYLDGSRGGSDGQILGGNFSTSGVGAIGIYVVQGAQADVKNASIQTSGANSYGIDLDQTGSNINLDNISISTSGGSAHGVWAISTNSTIDAKNFSIQTTGNAASGFNNRAASAALKNGSILTKGANAYALYASEEYGAGTFINGTNLDIRTEGQSAYGAYARVRGQISLADSSITTSGDSAIGVVITDAISNIGLLGTNIQTSGADAYGAYAYLGKITAEKGGILTQGDGAHGVAVLGGGEISLANVNVFTKGEDAYGAAFATGGGTLNVDGGSIASQQSCAFLAGGATSINLANGAQVAGGNGVLLDINDPNATIALTMDNGVVAEGDIRLDQGLIDDGVIPATNVAVSLTNGSHWAGATQDAISDLSLDSGSAWTVANNSSVGGLAVNDACIQFASPGNGAYKSLTVHGDFSGAGGVIGMNTLLNEGGELSNQQTDRLLILGNVTTTGATVLDITPQGGGASAPVDKQGLVGAGDGISLVQVGGTSRADAFVLPYGYVAVGPYKYTLHAFGPGQADASQNALPSGELNWDYRLAPSYVEVPPDNDNPGDPGNGDGGFSPDPAGGGTPVNPGQPSPPLGVVAQIPSYIAAPTALLAYGDTMIDTLHQRLGDIRETPPSDTHGGELFVRYIGSQQRYASNHRTYGYDFDQQINAVQLGGSLVSVVDDASSLRIGWALDKGTTRVTPRVFSSEDASFGRYDAHGVSAWMTWQQSNGFYVDAVVGGERYQGSIGTAIRDSDVARIRAGGWTASVETGYPFEIGRGWSVEPQLQVKRQSLSFTPFQDADNLDTQIQTGGQTSTRAGVRFAKTNDLMFAPYVRADFIRTVGGSSKITSSSDAWDVSGTFDGGRAGNSVRVGAGAASQILPYLSLYGEAGYQRNTSDYGLRGWQANLGLRFEF